MADTTDNVIQLASESDPAGVRSQRYRRKKQTDKKTRKKAPAKAWLSESAATVDSADNAVADNVTQEPKKSNEINEVSHGREDAPHAVVERDNIDVAATEFRPVRRGGGGGNFGGRHGAESAKHHTALDVMCVLSAIALAAITAWLSVNGMVVLFPGLPVIALLLGVAIEGAKITTSAWLGKHWQDAAWVSRVALIAFTAMCASLNAASVYSQLVQAHVGASGQLAATTETRNAETAGRIEVAQDKVADFDRRLRQIDDTISEASRRGRTREALRSIDQQRQARAALAGERERAARDLAGLKTERVQVSAQSRAAESESTPLRYLAEILNINAGPEALIRFLIAAIVACGDPFAIALLAAVAGRRRWA